MSLRNVGNDLMWYVSLPVTTSLSGRWLEPQAHIHSKSGTERMGMHSHTFPIPNVAEVIGLNHFKLFERAKPFASVEVVIHRLKISERKKNECWFEIVTTKKKAE